MNKRTIADILAEFKGTAKPIESGNVDGVQYQLFDSPSQAQKKTNTQD
jgi:hypothetical protein